MKARIIGIEEINFKNQVGEVISGTNIFIAYENPNTEGLRCDKVFLKEEINLPADVRPNELVEIYFKYAMESRKSRKNFKISNLNMESWPLSINELHNSPMLTKELLKSIFKISMAIREWG